ncbi:hypothetical protein [Burkholderia sp. SCN-KJ]|uniref:hypothetical protein n=1 Tax=Burkholderia sp. SCN-KJ TaxID=2969248 RepID=UPI0021506151|nr:hypothetical protein [Burkholderia sp. SCN-KJ]MCR4471136.1 hypothetical protein [Burkholderia sp. SCN-KJ]
MTGTDKKRTPQLLRVELTSPAERPFEIDAVDTASAAGLFCGPAARIEHPCDRFARGAGYTSWIAARTAMLAGAIVSGPGPRIGKSTLEYELFIKQVRLDGLVMVSPRQEWFGLVSVGILERFPKDARARATGAVTTEGEPRDGEPQ